MLEKAAEDFKRTIEWNEQYKAEGKPYDQVIIDYFNDRLQKMGK